MRKRYTNRAGRCTPDNAERRPADPQRGSWQPIGDEEGALWGGDGCNPFPGIEHSLLQVAPGVGPAAKRSLHRARSSSLTSDPLQVGTDQAGGRSVPSREARMRFASMIRPRVTIAANLTLVSNKLREFGRVSGLQTEDWAH